MKAWIRPYCEIIQTGTVFRFKSNHNKREGNVESRDLKKDLKIDAGGEDPEMWRPNAAHTFWPHSNKLPLEIPHPVRIYI